jgi:hypothetical protein
MGVVFMKDSEEFLLIIKEIQHVINSYTRESNIETKINFQNENRTLSINIEGISDLEIRFKDSSMNEKKRMNHST